ncbi:MAG: hypothetical protein M3279_06345 [Actinomycetota bacterium]|nr:hypothetical protein [Actinomycetota bacterium]
MRMAIAPPSIAARALVAATAALLVVSSVAIAAPAKGARPQVLAGKTVIKGAAASAVAVRLPAAARVQVLPPEGAPPGAPAPGIGIEGAGRVAGFYLTEPDVTNFGRTYLAGVQFRFCPGAGCGPEHRPYEYTYSSGYDAATGGPHEHPGAVELPAGDYLLYLVSDGAPVEVRLELQGLRGKTTIRPSSRVGSGSSMPNAENSTSIAGGKAFWYGHEAQFEGVAGMYAGAMRLDLKASTYLRVGLCISEGADALPPQVRDAPYCPGGTGAAEERTEAVPVDREVVKPWITFVDSGGDFAFGQHYMGVFTEGTVESVSFHMDLLAPASVRR